MNRSELTKKLARKLSITQADALRVIETWEEIFSEGLVNDGALTLMGFGTFSMWEQTERVGRNPKNGVPCMIRPRNSVKFKPGKNLLGRLNIDAGKR